MLVFGMLLRGAVSSNPPRGWDSAPAVGEVLFAALLARALYRTTFQHRLLPSLALLLLLQGLAVAGQTADLRVPAFVLWCGWAITAPERKPMPAALPMSIVALCSYALVNDDPLLTTTVTSIGLALALALAGYVLRLDAEARGNAQLLLAQERAARAAEAESAALAERARTAREIDDVLAHSLSAQLVHLEAAPPADRAGRRPGPDTRTGGGDREDPHQQPLRQDGDQGPCAGGALRLREGNGAVSHGVNHLMG
ncbi:hypothetical protein GCM10023084_30370 [Streptomyces lacrimifluminis]|uniref:Histidine kinase n=1 Tax=Streptomyces lacrimifluminis TaxID=1500077 RepID=A0A917KW93_9ACTN|nr:hypothetical protein GCM10012282_26990 [Streptomyces lacrimifluminis]